MPNPLQPPAPMLGLQKAQSIGPDPTPGLYTGKPIEAGMPDPERGPLASALTSLGRLAVPALRRSAPVAETLGEMAPEFTAVGGEPMYNVAKAGIHGPAPVDELVEAFKEKWAPLLAKVGIGK